MEFDLKTRDFRGKKKKDGSKIGFSKRLSAVNRRSKSSANCANYETASDVRFRFKPEPINNFVRIQERKKERKKEKNGENNYVEAMLGGRDICR